MSTRKEQAIWAAKEIAQAKMDREQLRTLAAGIPEADPTPETLLAWVENQIFDHDPEYESATDLAKTICDMVLKIGALTQNPVDTHR